MLDFLDQVDATADAGLYYMALAGALVVPDMCAAMSESSGRTTGKRYMAWFKANFPAEYEGYLSADECWGFRCSFLHQGNTYPQQTNLRVVFFEPGFPGFGHCLKMNDTHLMIDIKRFCNDMTNAARKWWQDSQGKEPFETNAEKFIRRHPDGIPPFILGAPIIG